MEDVKFSSKSLVKDGHISRNTSLAEKGPDSVISFQAELPTQLQLAMASFIEKYPNWDQYRLIQAALAGFLVQNGVNSRPITRLYVDNMFGSKFLSQAI